jgi:GntR family transcriptional regulator/MocR family aminotransferase
VLFEKELGEKVSFEKPQGGMAIWMKFSEKYPLALLSDKAHKKAYTYQMEAHISL